MTPFLNVFSVEIVTQAQRRPVLEIDFRQKIQFSDSQDIYNSVINVYKISFCSTVLLAKRPMMLCALNVNR